MAHWNGKTAIVCGASSGLGLALTRQLAQQGAARIALVARTTSTLGPVVAGLQGSFPGTDFVPFTADMTVEEDVKRLAKSIEQSTGPHFGSIDLLIQAVGKSARGEIDSLNADSINTLVQQNVLSSVHATQHLRGLLASTGGCIVLIGSLASKFTPRFLGGYAIAKHALAAFAGQARLELASEGHHVLLACPGPIARTDAGRRYEEMRSESLPDEALKPGGGAQIRGLDSVRLASDILRAAASRKPEIIRPRKARLLIILSAISPRIGDWLLRKMSS